MASDKGITVEQAMEHVVKLMPRSSATSDNTEKATDDAGVVGRYNLQKDSNISASGGRVKRMKVNDDSMSFPMPKCENHHDVMLTEWAAAAHLWTVLDTQRIAFEKQARNNKTLLFSSLAFN